MNEVFYEGITLDGKALKVGVSGKNISSVCEIPRHDKLPRLLPLLVDIQQNGALEIGRAHV